MRLQTPTLLYKSGYPFDLKTKAALDQLIDRVFNKDFGAMGVIEGGVGQGKTTFGVHCADYIQGEPIDFDKQLAFGGLEFQKKLKTCFLEKKRVIIYDEAGDFNRRSALTKFNADLNRVFETFRAFKIVVILILPCFIDLDDSMFKKEIPRVFFHCYSRRKNTGYIKAYSLYKAFYLRYHMNRSIVKPMAYTYQTPNYYGNFLNLPPERCEELTKFSIKGKFKILRNAEKRAAGLKSSDEISAELGITSRQFWSGLGRLNIKAVDKDGRKYLYSPNQVQMMKQFFLIKKAKPGKNIDLFQKGGKYE